MEVGVVTQDAHPSGQDFVRAVLFQHRPPRPRPPPGTAHQRPNRSGLASISTTCTCAMSGPLARRRRGMAERGEVSVAAFRVRRPARAAAPRETGGTEHDARHLPRRPDLSTTVKRVLSVNNQGYWPSRLPAAVSCASAVGHSPEPGSANRWRAGPRSSTKCCIRWDLEKIHPSRGSSRIGSRSFAGRGFSARPSAGKGSIHPRRVLLSHPPGGRPARNSAVPA